MEGVFKEGQIKLYEKNVPDYWKEPAKEKQTTP